MITITILILRSFLFIINFQKYFASDPFNHPNIYLTFSVVNCVTVLRGFVIKVSYIESKRENQPLVLQLPVQRFLPSLNELIRQSVQQFPVSSGERRVTACTYIKSMLFKYIYFCSHLFDKSNIDFMQRATRMSQAAILC